MTEKKINKHSRLYGRPSDLTWVDTPDRPQTKEEKEWVEGARKWFAKNHGDKKRDKE